MSIYQRLAVLYQLFHWASVGPSQFRINKMIGFQGHPNPSAVVWNIGFIFKLKSYSVDSSLLEFIENYLTDRQQRVILNGQTFSWENILAGNPQSYVLEPLLFLIYLMIYLME